MDAKTLRRACEVAGLVFLPGIGKHGRDDAWVLDNPFKSSEGWWLHPDHPALPAYVASLLVAMARERKLSNEMWQASKLSNSHWHTATDEQRIAAALEVLSDE